MGSPSDYTKVINWVYSVGTILNNLNHIQIIIGVMSPSYMYYLTPYLFYNNKGEFNCHYGNFNGYAGNKSGVIKQVYIAVILL